MRFCVFMLLLVYFSGVQYAAGQEAVSRNKKAEAGYRAATEAYKKKDYGKALELLDRVAEFDNSFAELYLLRADIFHRQGKAEEKRAIERALEIEPLKYTSYYFILGDIYFGEGMYERALECYETYAGKDKKLNRLQEARKKMDNCKFAIEALRTQVKGETECFIRSDSNDVYWPSVDVTGRTVLYTELGKGEENIYMLKGGRSIALGLNTAANEGTQSVTADGRMMYFTACGRPGGMGSCDIYVAYRLSDSSWSEPVNLGYPVNTEGWEAQPAISADGTRLYFASVRDGGRGGSDIWFSRLLRREANGRQVWSQPKCLYFNTVADEMAPYLYYDNRTLFFSSGGYPGMGGMDIYKVDVMDVTEPENIGITVNTQKDELGFMVDGTGEWGYFASDVSGRKCIYRYRLEEDMKCPEAAYIRLLVQDERGQRLVPDCLTVVAVATGDTVAFYDETCAYGEMIACVPPESLLLIGSMKRGYMYYSDTLYCGPADHAHPREKEVVMRELRAGLPLVLKGVFFDVDDHRLKPESYAELNQVAEFMRLNRDVKIEISGHTDDTGTPEHNYRLSEARALEVYKYLFDKKIKKDRMTYKGYGKDAPLVPNDSEADRAVNRRTEIRVKD